MSKPCAALVCGLMLLAGAVRAEEAASVLELEWTAPAECPQSVEVKAEVLSLIGGKALGPSRLAAQGTVTSQADARWTVVLKTSIAGAEGERSISGPTCQAVSDAAALTLALTLDPNLRLPDTASDQPGEPPDTGRPGLSGPGGSTQPNRSASRGTAPRRAPLPHRVTVVSGQMIPVARSHTEWLARAVAGGRLGTLPKLAAEIGLGLGVARGGALGWLVGSYVPDQSVDSASKSDVARVWAGSATALGCYRLELGSTEIDPCGGLELTLVSGRGTDAVVHPRSDVLFWLSPTLGASFGYRPSRAVRLSLDGFGAVPVARPEGRIQGRGTVFQPGRLAGRGIIGVELRLR